MKLFIFWAAFCVISQNDVPFKPSDEFKVALDYKFESRRVAEANHFDMPDPTSQKKKTSTGPLPYLLINFKVLKLSEGEVRIKAVDGRKATMFSKKAEVDGVYKLDLGFTDDMKDRVTPHEFNIYFLSSSKKEISRVNLFIKEDGTFMVNDEVRGKF